MQLDPHTARLTARPHASLARVLLLAGLIVLAGCSQRPARVAAPSFDPDGSARKALELHDTNKDGALDAKELAGCPGLKSCAKRVDTNQDGKLDPAEITARLASYVESRTGLMQFRVQVVRGSSPLEGASVSLEPEPFLGSVVEPATGTTGPDGSVYFAVAGQSLPGVRPGMYRVRISKKDGSGRETIAKRYNTESNLGVEANPLGLEFEELADTRVFQL